MSYRPYPNVDRALHQLDRHYLPLPVPVVALPECLLPMAESMAQLRRDTRRALERGFGGGYVMSSRRPRVVGPAS